MSSQIQTSDVCSICLNSMVQGEPLYTTSCSHTFHFSCITNTIKSKIGECPLCRKAIDQSLIQVLQPVSSTIPSTTDPPSTPVQQTTSRFSFLNVIDSAVKSVVSVVGNTFQRSSVSTPTKIDKNDSLCTKSEDLVDEKILNHLAAERARRQATRKNKSTVELIKVSTVLEFVNVHCDDERDMFGMLTLKAPTDSGESEDDVRTSLDLVCVVDRSGSMQGEKIALLKQTLSYIVEQLKSTDRLSIISFNTVAIDVLGGLKMMTTDKKVFVENQIQTYVHLNAEGGTYIGSGLQMGIDLLNQRKTKNPLTSLLLLTDGQDNQLCDYSDLIQRIPQGCTIHTFGYGRDHWAHVLSQIAEQGHGTFTFIEQLDKIADAFAAALGGLFTCIGQQLEVKIELDEDYKITEVLSTYPHTNQLPNQTTTITLNDLNADEKRDLVFQIHVPKVEQEQEQQAIGRVSLRYLDPGNRQQLNTESESFNLSRSRSPSDIASNYALDVQRNRCYAARALKQAVKYANDNEMEKAEKLLKDVIDKIKSSISVNDQLCQQLIEDLEHTYNDRVQFTSTMTNMHMQHGQQRATYSCGTTISAQGYMTGGQERYRTYFNKNKK
ncbi:unnamed protein product [Didymodactylos carnosus]|uniref:Uncharacterized protein n=1 Tax=Didymodactylos carnosus TaxID=1234261 RepID=A0A815H3J8_9BILA|nr:unnamed protein product [Didymodactylos carnosus]CAF1345846.1 unnamed protein product [Didymodactylos carnosus]CAF4073027.1 unnamed protein product [Didymodactylos carnosus]CAF4211274.1 unnamed protein product [Didymodactylos carnosus]